MGCRPAMTALPWTRRRAWTSSAECWANHLGMDRYGPNKTNNKRRPEKLREEREERETDVHVLCVCVSELLSLELSLGPREEIKGEALPRPPLVGLFLVRFSLAFRCLLLSPHSCCCCSRACHSNASRCADGGEIFFCVYFPEPTTSLGSYWTQRTEEFVFLSLFSHRNPGGEL